MYRDVELRKLPAGTLCDVINTLETNNDWKTVMTFIPKNPKSNNFEPKYHEEHVRLIEEYARLSNRQCAEILLDEWGTSGRIRPTLSTLKAIVLKANILKAADQIAALLEGVLEQVIAKCVPGASAREICEFGDKLILEETSKVFKKEKDSKKGIAFSTCVSVNNCICHFSPIPSETDYILKQGDLAKIDLGAHIDGFIAVVAHTVVVGVEEVTGRAADVLLAAYLASEAALRLLRPGNENYAITDVVQKISAEYACKPVEGMLSHQLKQFRIDGEKSIIQNPSEAQRKEHEKATLETYEVYAMDVLVSTGEGVGREMDTRCTIYKKTDEVYQLKLKASRMFYSEVRNKHGSMPFNLRSFDKETSARLGVVECVNHKLIEPFQVLYERPGELVAQFKFTALLLPSGTHKITGLPFDKSICKSDRSIKDPELNSLLNSSAKSNKKKKKKAGAEEAMEVETAA